MDDLEFLVDPINGCRVASQILNPTVVETTEVRNRKNRPTARIITLLDAERSFRVIEYIVHQPFLMVPGEPNDVGVRAFSSIYSSFFLEHNKPSIDTYQQIVKLNITGLINGAANSELQYDLKPVQFSKNILIYPFLNSCKR